MPLDAGSKLGPYEILSPLGAGGMGEVCTSITDRSRLVGLGYLEAFPRPWSRSCRSLPTRRNPMAAPTNRWIATRVRPSTKPKQPSRGQRLSPRRSPSKATRLSASCTAAGRALFKRPFRDPPSARWPSRYCSKGASPRHPRGGASNARSRSQPGSSIPTSSPSSIPGRRPTDTNSA